MTDIKTSLKLRQHEGWKETLEYIERLEKALGVAKNYMEEIESTFLTGGDNDDAEDARHMKSCALEALKEISDIMGGG